MSNSNFHRAGSQMAEKPMALDSYLRTTGQSTNMPLSDPKLSTNHSDLSKSSVDYNNNNLKGFALGSVENPISLQTGASCVVGAPMSSMQPEIVRVRYTSIGEGSVVQSNGSSSNISLHSSSNMEGWQQGQISQQPAPIVDTKLTPSVQVLNNSSSFSSVPFSQSSLQSSSVSLSSNNEISQEAQLARVHKELLQAPPQLFHVPWPVEEKHLPTTVSIQHPFEEETKPSLTEKIQTTLGNMKDTITEKASTMKDTITGTASSVKDTITEKASTLKDTIQSKISKTEDTTPVVEEETIVTEVYNPADDVLPTFVYMAPAELSTTEKISSKIKETTLPMKEAVSNAASSASTKLDQAATYTKETVLPQIGNAATYTKETVLPQIGHAASSAATYTKDTIIPNVATFTKESVLPRVEQAAIYTKDTILPKMMEAASAIGHAVGPAASSFANSLKEKVRSVMHRRTASGRVVEEEVDVLHSEHKEGELEDIQETSELRSVWPRELLNEILYKRPTLRHVAWPREKTIVEMMAFWEQEASIVVPVRKQSSGAFSSTGFSGESKRSTEEFLGREGQAPVLNRELPQVHHFAASLPPVREEVTAESAAIVPGSVVAKDASVAWEIPSGQAVLAEKPALPSDSMDLHSSSASTSSSFSEKFESVKASASDKFESVKSTASDLKASASDKFESVKASASDKLESVKASASDLKASASDKLGSVKASASDKLESVKASASDLKITASDKFESFKSSAAEKFESAKSSASDHFEQAKDMMSDKLESAKVALSGAADKVKGALGMDKSSESTDLETKVVSTSTLNTVELPAVHATIDSETLENEMRPHHRRNFDYPKGTYVSLEGERLEDSSIDQVKQV